MPVKPGLLGLRSTNGPNSMTSPRIGIDSFVGQGEAPIAAAPPLQPSMQPATEKPAVLVAEDNQLIRRLIGKLLSKRGYQADFTVNGKEALAAVQRKSYDVILMDMHMPELDGMAATRLIRGLAGPARLVPIIALTGDALAGQHEICLAAGMNDYLSKPFDAADFYHAIDRWSAKPAAQPPIFASSASDISKLA
jgi:CheY-like chemotaxis protein